MRADRYMLLNLNQRRRGYVLIVTLGVLVLASTLLVSLGRGTMRRIADARAAVDDLQRRWGAASCRVAILPNAETLLDAAEQRERRPVPVLATRLRLGNQTFDLTIADEQAKADVHLLLADRTVADAEATLRRSLLGYGLADKVRLRPELGVPLAAAAPDFVRPQPIGGFGQIFTDLPPDEWTRPPVGGGPAVADFLTCWAGGRVNVRRASEPALRLAVSPPLTPLEVGRLIDARDQLFYPDGLVIRPPNAAANTGNRGKMRQLIEGAGLTQSLGRAASRLVDGSTRHSLLISAGDGSRRWRTFAVIDTADINRPQWIVHSW